jgi:hypothetical protein
MTHTLKIVCILRFERCLPHSNPALGKGREQEIELPPEPAGGLRGVALQRGIGVKATLFTTLNKQHPRPVRDESYCLSQTKQ